MQKQRFDALDGLRGMGALIVLSFHIAHVEKIHAPFAHGYFIVDFFFMMSGFVLAHGYDEKLQSGAMSFWRYARMRILRFYPLIAIGALLGAVQMYFYPIPRAFNLPLSLGLQLAFVPEITTPNIFMVNYVQWSLFFEFFVNFTHAALIRFFRRPVFFGAAILGTGGLFLVANHIAGVRILGPGGGWLFAGGFPRTMFPYFIGVALYRAYEAGYFRLIGPRVRAVLFPILFALVFFVLCAPLKPIAVGDAVQPLLIICVLFPLVVVAAAETQLPEWIAQPARGLGAASFPLYCVHLPIVFAAAHYLSPPTVPVLGKIVGWSFVAVSVIALAFGIERLERHIRAVLKRGQARPQPTAEPYGDIASAD